MPVREHRMLKQLSPASKEKSHDLSEANNPVYNSTRLLISHQA